MKTRLFLRLASSAALFALTSVGCSTVTPGPLASASDAPRPAKSAVKAQAQAQKALANGRHDDAIGYAEAAVLTDPDNPELRALLGQAYLSAGRFQSAGDSFDEAIILGRSDARSIIGLALADTAQGNVGAALRLLDANKAVLPVADYGLAVALAGDTKQAVTVLTDAIRLDGASVKTRQNLALAYALDGRWREARIMAAQDLAPAEVDARIASWAQMARPGAYETRVAGLLGVAPVSDAGRPIGVALNFAAPQAEMLASAEPMAGDTPLPAGPAPMEGGQQLFAAAESNPILPVRAEAIAAPVAPARSAPLTMAAVKPMPTAAAAKRDAVPSMHGSHLVQLGAFSSPENATRAWALYQRRYPMLKRYDSASGQVTVGGRRFYRLAAMGFQDGASANRICSRLKSEGGSCIVRTMRSGDAVQYAAGTMSGRVLASR